MYFFLDLYFDQLVRGMIMFKFLPGLMIEAHSNSCKPNVSSENSQHEEQD